MQALAAIARTARPSALSRGGRRCNGSDRSRTAGPLSQAIGPPTGLGELEDAIDEAGAVLHVAELLHPAGMDGVGVALEGQEGTLDFLVRPGALDDAIGEADVAEGARLPELPSFFALSAGDDAVLEAVLAGEAAATGHEDNVGVAQ
eukprot:8134008-Alexandrium_andersonii.AAC.1